METAPPQDLLAVRRTGARLRIRLEGNPPRPKVDDLDEFGRLWLDRIFDYQAVIIAYARSHGPSAGTVALHIRNALLQLFADLYPITASPPELSVRCWTEYVQNAPAELDLAKSRIESPGYLAMLF